MATKKNRKKGGERITNRQLLSLLLIISLMTTAATAATGTVDVSTVYQELEGFGASNVWSGYELVYLSYYHPEIYDVIFGDLGLDILRLRNTYGYPGGSSYINNCQHTVTNGRARTGRPLKLMISSWSPPGYLKSNGGESGGDDATLAGGPDNYVYEDYADWWADSLQQYASQGMVADYISIQNEPDYDASWDSCRFERSETTSIAGYDTAFETVWQELNTRMGSSMPKMLAPETAHMGRAYKYINKIDDLSHVYGYSHHLYGCGDGTGGAGCAHHPEYYIRGMTSLGTRYNDKPILQTEYSDDTYVATHEAAMDLALLMYNSLVYEGVAGYLYWQLTWDDAGLVSITYTDWTINPIYYAFKHYSALTDPGWHRVKVSLSGHGDSVLRISAFMSPENDELTIVIINLDSYDYLFTVNLNNFLPESSEIYQSTSTEYWADIGPFNPLITLASESITTIHLTGVAFSNCAEVLAADYGLTSDISSDCYVDYKDLKIIADYWLSSDCGGSNDYCDGADFEPRDNNVDLLDLGKFGLQWMLCNDPQDPNCTPNWQE